MIVCVNCGQINETAASRCLRCGASSFEYPSYLGSVGSAPSAPVPGSSPPPAPPPKPVSPPHRPPPPSPYRTPYGTSQPFTPPPAPMPTVPPSGSPTVPYIPPLPIQPVVVGGFVCPYCRTNLPPRLTSRVSPAGWVIFALLLLLCWPLFWVGFLIREEGLRCRNCGRQLA